MEGLNTYHVLPTLKQAAQKSGWGGWGGYAFVCGGLGGDNHKSSSKLRGAKLNLQGR